VSQEKEEVGFLMRGDSRLKMFGVSLLAVVLVGSLAPLASPLADAVKGKPAEQFRMEPIQVEAGTLQGVIKGYTGKLQASTSLELLDEKGNVVARTITNVRGEYVLKDIPPGKYTAVIRGKVKLPVTMTTEPVVYRLMVVPEQTSAAAVGQPQGGVETGDPPAIPGFDPVGKNPQGCFEYRHSKTGLLFVLVPGGSFAMGSPSDETGRFPTEGPVHSVTVAPFLIAKTEVTQAVWRAVMGTRPWWGRNFTRDGARFPACCVNWFDVGEFNRKVGLRLPSEAEWEYACRAGSKTRYCFGDDEAQLKDYAWFDENTFDVGKRSTRKVATRKPNGFGLHDMHGNVSEWCADTWHPDYEGAPTDGRVWIDDSEKDAPHVIRGMSWLYDAWNVRSATRVREAPTFQTDHLGFRPSASIPVEKKE
jgi:formylglycine-generating enzyme required for sulfatase activity